MRSAQESVEILGTQNVFNLFLSSAIEYSFQDKGEDVLIIKHAIKIAVAMSELAKEIDDVHSGDAYLYGILYNIGHVVLNRYDHHFYKDIYLESLLKPSFGPEKEGSLSCLQNELRG